MSMSPTAWSDSLLALSAALIAEIPPNTDSGHAQTVWWGSPQPALLGHCARSLPGTLRVAEADPRRLRRALAAAGPASQALRLVDPFDLRLDDRGIEAALGAHATRNLDAYLALRERISQQAQQAPAVGDASAQVLVLDLLLNQRAPQDLAPVLQEAFRVLPRHGLLACVVVLANEAVAGAHTVRCAQDDLRLFLPSEQQLLNAIEQAGFHGLQLHLAANEGPVVIDQVEGADLRLALVTATKGKQGPCFELGQAVIYRGPWRQVSDDDGHLYPRGARVAVCAKTYDLLMRAPYVGQFIGLRSVQEPPLSEARLFDCNTPALRPPAVTKGLAEFDGAIAPGSQCAPGSGCC